MNFIILPAYMDVKKIRNHRTFNALKCQMMFKSLKACLWWWRSWKRGSFTLHRCKRVKNQLFWRGFMISSFNDVLLRDKSVLKILKITRIEAFLLPFLCSYHFNLMWRRERCCCCWFWDTKRALRDTVSDLLYCCDYIGIREASRANCEVK